MNLRLLGTLLLAHLTTDLAQGMIPALLPFFIAERGLSFAAAGGLVLAATVASSIVQPLFGYFADRRPSPWLVPAGVAAAGIGIGLAGVAPTYPLIAAAVAFHGLGVAAFHPEGSRAAAYASGDRRATGMSIFSTGGNLGMATGPLVITPLVLAYGLRASLVPLFPILLIAGFLVTQLPILAALHPSAPARSGAATPVPDRWGPFGRLAVVVVTRSVVYTGLATFLPLVFVGVLGTSKARGAAALSILLGTGVVGTLAGGRLADRYGRRIVLLVGMTALAPLLVALATTRDARVATLLLVPVALALYLPFSVLVVMGQEYLPNRVGTASGVTLGLAVTAGGVAAPILGAVADRWGIGAPLLVVSALPLLAVALALTLPDSRAGAAREAVRA
ncbi:MAG TPA: MFS transporter [Thermoanaerobaculia bacterium]|nr:MFS transporter [Thermoanaerobaculia bacterium]